MLPYMYVISLAFYLFLYKDGRERERKKGRKGEGERDFMYTCNIHNVYTYICVYSIQTPSSLAYFPHSLYFLLKKIPRGSKVYLLKRGERSTIENILYQLVKCVFLKELNLRAHS
jgi:hypothetical protein